jgi:hypothetical protein
MIADLDTLLIALYVELTDRIIPFREPGRRRPGRPRKSPTPSSPAWPWRRWHNWQTGAPVKRSLIAYDHV